MERGLQSAPHPSPPLLFTQALSLNVKQHEEWAMERGLGAAPILPVPLGARIQRSRQRTRRRLKPLSSATTCWPLGVHFSHQQAETSI